MYRCRRTLFIFIVGFSLTNKFALYSSKFMLDTLLCKYYLFATTRKEKLSTLSFEVPCLRYS